MKTGKITLRSIIAVITFLYLIAIPVKNATSEQNQVSFGQNTSYDIYYSLDKQAQCVANVKIIGTTTINGVTFLQIQSPAIISGSGYILFSSIRAILPAGSYRPQNIR